MEPPPGANIPCFMPPIVYHAVLDRRPAISRYALIHQHRRLPALLRLSGLAICAALLLAACGKSTEDPSGTTGPAPASQVDDRPSAESPLAKAARRGDLETVRELLDAGNEVNVTDALGRTPLHMAAFYGRPRTSELLLERGAEVNAGDRVGMTPLHAAVLDGRTSVAEILLARGADINAASHTGLTPLHLAAATGQPAIARLLLGRGADPQRKDKDGKTPADYATRNDHPKTLAQIQSMQARR